ncbi:MAG: class I SAM-dependent methyltransferase [Archaeoglobus sp.]|nr:class I SAM-dependent methyltransferase [Archaeoglobus sp.]
MSVFDPEKAEILDSEDRKKIEPIDVLIRKVERIDRREVAVEVGAGTGYYTIPLSNIFRRVYAIDLSFKMAEKLGLKLSELKIRNVGIIETDRPPELDFPIDLILFANVLHEIEEPERYLEWAKKGDYTLIVDWKKVDMSFGPPYEERLSEDDILKILKKLGFEIEEVDSYSMPYHYLILAKRR